MMLFNIVMPVVAAILYVIVFQKAGFRGAVLAVAAAPVLGAFLSYGVMIGVGLAGMPLLALIVVASLISLAPLLVLAFASWPPVAGAEEDRK